MQGKAYNECITMVLLLKVFSDYATGHVMAPVMDWVLKVGPRSFV